MNNTTNPVKSTQVYWCQNCDAKQVDSSKPETGKFFQQFGHEFVTGDYTSVFYALCNDCIDMPRDEFKKDAFSSANFDISEK